MHQSHIVTKIRADNSFLRLQADNLLNTIPGRLCVKISLTLVPGYALIIGIPNRGIAKIFIIVVTGGKVYPTRFSLGNTVVHGNPARHRFRGEIAVSFDPGCTVVG